MDVLGCPRTGSRNRSDLVENSTVDFSWHDPLWEKRLKLNSCEYEALTGDRERWNKKAERKKERKKGRKEGRKKEIKAWNEIERETEKWKKEKEGGSPIRGYERFGIKDGIKGMRKIDTGMLLKMHCPRQLRPHLLRVFTLNRSLLVHWTRQLFHEVMEG